MSKVTHGLLVGRDRLPAKKRREIDRAYYQARREKLNEQARARSARMTEEQKAKRKSYFAEWYARNRDRVRANDVKYKYGVDAVEYSAMLVSQGGGCAICRRPESDVKGRRLHVDHCHATGRVRGLLCARCNIAIGQMLDEPKLLRAAADYLERTAQS